MRCYISHPCGGFHGEGFPVCAAGVPPWAPPGVRPPAGAMLVAGGACAAVVAAAAAAVLVALVVAGAAVGADMFKGSVKTVNFLLKLN